MSNYITQASIVGLSKLEAKVNVKTDKTSFNNKKIHHNAHLTKIP